VNQNDLGVLLAVAGVGAAAYFLLRPETASADGSPYEAPIYGTGTALREPVPITVTEKPGFLDSVLDWFKSDTATDYKSPAQWRDELRPLFRRQENSYAMPDGFLEAVAEKESGFNHDIITCVRLGGVGEEGIMQLRPEYHLDSRASRCNPQVAIPYAANFLAKNFMRFGTWTEALAAYNWGPTNLETRGLNAAPAATKRYIAFVKERSADFA
jgi:hypothetical protein